MSFDSPLAEAILRTVAAASAHRTFFTAVTALASGLIAAGAFWLRKSVLPKEQWLHYFSLGFGIFTIQYGYPSLFGIYGLFVPLQSPIAPPLASWASAIASSANNVVFLAAALSLMRHKIVRPWWSWTLAVVATAVDLSCSEIRILSTSAAGPWSRTPDAAFSAISLGWLGYALFTNISPRRRKRLAIFALIGGFFYAWINVLYALNPLLMEGGLWPELKTAVTESLVKREVTPRHAIDTYLFAWALPMKIFLAIGGFILVFRTFMAFSPKALERSLARINRRGTDFLIGEAFIGILGDHFQADRASLCFRLPGLLDERVAWWEWYRTEPASRVEPLRKPRVSKLPRPDDSPEGSVLASGEPYQRARISGIDLLIKVSSAQEHVYPSKIVVPIVSREVYVGCLSAEWNAEFAFTPTAVDQLHLLADLFAPAIDQRLRLASIYYLTEELQNLKLEHEDGFRGIATQVAALLHRTLAPLSVSLSLDIGFRMVWAVAGDGGRASSTEFGGEPGHIVSDMLYSLSGLPEPHVTVRRSRLAHRNIRIGTLSLAWPHPDSNLEGLKTRPAVVPDYLLRRSIAEFAAAFILNASHVSLTSVLNNLQTALGDKDVQTRENWFSLLEASVVASGLLWIVADYSVGGVHGQEAHVEAVRRQMNIQPDSGYPSIQVWSLSEELAGAHKLLRLRLSTTGAELWLGVANHRFELPPALQDDWPWKVFLERFAAAADSALSRITASEEVQRLRTEADQYQSLFAAGADAATFFHECRNIARNFTFTVQSLQEAWDLQLVTSSPAIAPDIEKKISGLLETAKRLYGLTDHLMKNRRQGRQIICNLLHVSQEIKEIAQYVLLDTKIAFDISGVDNRAFVNAPFYVAHQAILSLVSNSIDAIRQGGGSSILLKTGDAGDKVLLRVIDDGPGIPVQIKERLFILGTSSKTGTGGKGLFIIRNLLRQYGTDIRLESSSVGCTVFLIEFSRALERKEV